MPGIELVVRLLVVGSILMSSLPPAFISASPARQPRSQTEEPSPTPTDTPPAGATATVSPTDTSTSLPSAQPPSGTETPTLLPTDTSVPTSTETVTPPASPQPPSGTDTPTPTTTQPPSSTDTPTVLPTETTPATATPTLTPTADLTLTPTLTPTAVLTLTPTLTPTLTLGPVNLSLTLTADPAFVQLGDFVTVTLTLSNPDQIQVENLTISSTLPAGLSYDQPLGAVVPGFNPILQLLTWQIPPELISQPSLTFGYVGRVAPDALASALSLAAEISQPVVAGISQAQTSLIILAPVVVTPTPVPVGPPAYLQLGVQPEQQKSDSAAEADLWVAVSVVDADGLAVADGTEVTLAIQGDKLEQSVLHTKAGIASTQFKAPPGQTVTLTASAGAVQSSLQWPSPDSEYPPYSTTRPGIRAMARKPKPSSRPATP